MKKNFIAMVMVVLLCALTTACGGSSSTSSNNSDIPSDGVLGENGREIYDLMNEFMITIDRQKKELQKECVCSGLPPNLFDKFFSNMDTPIFSAIIHKNAFHSILHGLVGYGLETILNVGLNNIYRNDNGNPVCIHNIRNYLIRILNIYD